MRSRHATFPVAVAIAVASAACASAGGTRGRTVEVPANAEWTERVELRLDERLILDGRALEVQPLSIGVNRATLQVRANSIDRTIDLQADTALDAETVPPYHIRLVSTSAEPSVTIQVTKLKE